MTAICAGWVPSAAAVLLAADRPGRRARLGQERSGALVLFGLRRGGGVAAAAHRPPGRAGELVLAAVLAVAADRGRVAAGFALGDACERARGVAGRGARCAARGGLRRRRWQPERGRGLRPDDAIDRQPVLTLEGAHGARGR